ncbi:MAG: O-antigen ligase domain-containing protein, partial [Comamonadaceae bacterium]
MAWSHAYLGGVEAVRWFLFGLVLWLGLNSFTRERLPLLAWGVHLGAFVASLWAALQFWVDLSLFPQGPNPASTFVNRNFYAEFAACTLPFSAMLLARARQTAAQAVLAAMLGLVVVAILMTGTRAALIAVWLQALVVLPWLAWRYRRSLPLGQWAWSHRSVAAGALLLTVVGLGVVPSGNPKILEEGRGATPIERGLRRTASISPGDESLQVRQVMWAATLRMVRAHPVTGVGAGAWEVQVPLYQEHGQQLETDFYPHNEFLQLLAEDGLVGLVVLLGLFGYLLRSAWVTWRSPADEEGAWRGVALTSLLALMVVSNVGFAWRMASTGALFALCLALLAASDRRLGLAGGWAPRALAWTPRRSVAALAAAGACSMLAVSITVQALE